MCCLTESHTFCTFSGKSSCTPAQALCPVLVPAARTGPPDICMTCSKCPLGETGPGHMKNYNPVLPIRILFIFLSSLCIVSFSQLERELRACRVAICSAFFAAVSLAPRTLDV